jgi:hypothetical protein
VAAHESQGGEYSVNDSVQHGPWIRKQGYTVRHPGRHVTHAARAGAPSLSHNLLFLVVYPAEKMIAGMRDGYSRERTAQSLQNISQRCRSYVRR